MLFSLLTCREALERLDDYLDRELSPRDIVLVERHLKICRQCARHFARQADFIRDLRTRLDRLEAPSGLLEKIAQQLPPEPVTADGSES